ncbi:MAG: response regulator [Deltaproteobacteria bacterium]|nr:MAG: response regulator [Deltaproteobacteria bacterium]RLC20147.1 MAG: response regulator [Deltaproteobacteria bacterium]
MNPTKILRGKRILIVDDEPDVIESLIELLDMCKIDTATSFSDGKKLLENQSYDIAILDIMGVEGFELLKIANDQNLPVLMLTAHALSEKNLIKSAKEGAAYFVPKDKMSDIDIFLIDIFQALDKNKSTWERLFDRLGGFYDKRFQGTNWRVQEKRFWEKKMKTRF